MWSCRRLQQAFFFLINELEWAKKGASPTQQASLQLQKECNDHHHKASLTILLKKQQPPKEWFKVRKRKMT
jgi:hypothetical protein